MRVSFDDLRSSSLESRTIVFVFFVPAAAAVSAPVAVIQALAMTIWAPVAPALHSIAVAAEHTERLFLKFRAISDAAGHSLTHITHQTLRQHHIQDME